jgi:hypothetical protein
MTNRISAPEFVQTELAGLRPGDTAFHGMLYPGVYPTRQDVETHQDLLVGRAVDIDTPFQQQMRELAARCVTLQWLRVIPEAGLFGYTKADVRAMRQNAEVIAEASHADVRVTGYEQHARMLGKLAPSWIIDSYLDGASSPDPKASFWRIDSRDSMNNPVKVSVMDYEGGTFIGHNVYSSPIPEEVDNYTNYWLDVYHTQAQSA